jgi:hypothetical protein
MSGGWPPSSIIVTVSAIRFLYAVTLRRNWAMEIAIPAPQQPKTLPVILSPEEVAQFLACVRHIRHRTILTVCYAAGLRVSEAVGLKVADVDSSRMVLRVEQGKGQKDRYVMLSPRLLEILRDWWRIDRPQPLLFPGPGGQPLTRHSVEIACPKTLAASGIDKPVTPHSLRHAFAVPTCSSAASTCGPSSCCWDTPEPGTPRRGICGSPPPRCGRPQAPWTCCPIFPRRNAEPRIRPMHRPGPEVADVVRRHGRTFLKQGGIPFQHRRVLRDIARCRTAALGGHLERCVQCGREHPVYNPCSNRHCPKCGAMARAKWVAARKAELIDCPYFHVVFTLPDRVADIALQNKRIVYAILFRAAAETLLRIAADPKHLGARIGFFAVLHTWGQNLLHHPHLHCVVPGGGISPDPSRWIACRPGFFLPVRVLSRLFPSPVPPVSAGGIRRRQTPFRRSYRASRQFRPVEQPHPAAPRR